MGTDSNTAITVISGILIALGVFGVLVPFLPGLVVSWLGVLLWAIFTDGGSARWWVLGIASVLTLISLIMRVAGPWRALRRTGVPVRSIVVGGLFGIVGFFVIPVIGLILGFILGVFIAEWVRLARAQDAWPSTKTALRAVGVVLLLELFLGLVIAVVWVVGVFIT